jgi:hypothetical protein
MTDEKKPKDLSAERAREIILKRRARFMAAALAGLTGLGCNDGPTVCLSLAGPDDGAPDDDDSGPCLSAPRDAGRFNLDAGPRVCLTPIRPDAGVPDASRNDAGDAGIFEDVDAGPRVCLNVVTATMEDDDEKSS